MSFQRAGRLIFAALWLIVGPISAASSAEAPSDDGLYDAYLDILHGDPYQEYALRRLLEVSGDKGGLEGLVVHLEARLEKRPDDSSLWLVLGHVHREARQSARALDAYDHAASLLESHPGPRTAMARLHRQSRSWEASLAQYDAAVERAGGGRDARQEITHEALETALEAGLLERANAYGLAYVAVRPSHLPTRMELAATLGRLGHPGLALEAWQEAREAARGQLRYLVSIWPEMARLQEQGGKLDEAEATWREALQKTSRKHWARSTFLDGLIGVYRRRDALRDLLAELILVSGDRFLEAAAVARLHEELGEDGEALHWYRRAARLRRGDLESRRKVVELLRRSGTTRELLDAYGELERVSPREPSFRLERAEVALQRGQRRQGLKLLEGVLRRFSRDPGVHQRVIDLLVRYGGERVHGQIERTYRRLTRLEPREPAHLVSLGELYWGQGKRERALATWRGLIGQARSPWRGHLLLAEVLSEHDLHRLAGEHYEAAIQRAPGDLRVAMAYARWLDAQGRTTESLKSWHRVLEITAPDPERRLWAMEARRAIVGSWDKLGRLAGSMEELAKRTTADPPDLDAGLLLTEALLYRRRWEEAESVLLRIRAAAPKRLDALRALEALYTRSNRHSDALGVLDDIATLEDAYGPEILARAARLALRTGDEERALGLTLRLVKEPGGGAVARLEAGELFMQLGRLQSAAEAWSGALVLNPRDDELRLRLAALYQRLDRPLDEEQLLTTLVRESLDQGHVLRAGKRLVQLAISHDRLESLERVLVPLVTYGGRRREIHLRLLTSVYGAMTHRLRWSPDSSEGLRVLGERALNPLIEALGIQDVSMRSQALDVLELTRSPGSVPALARLLEQADASARLRAASILGTLGTASAVTALSRFASRSTAAVRHMAIWALGLSRSQEAESALMQLKGLEPGDRVVWVLALGMQSGERSGPELRRRLHKGVPGERLACLWALAHQGRADSLDSLARVLDRGLRHGPNLVNTGDGQGTVHGWHHLAAWGLGRIGTDESRQALLERLWSAGPGPRNRAVVLGLFTEPGAEHALESARARYRAMIAPRGWKVVASTSALISLVPAQAELPTDLRTQEALVVEVSQVIDELMVEARPGRVARFLTGVARRDGAVTLPELVPDEVSAEISHQIAALLAPHRPRLVSWARSSSPELASASLDVLGSLSEQGWPTPELSDLVRWSLDHGGPRVQGAAVRALTAAAKVPARFGSLEARVRRQADKQTVTDAVTNLLEGPELMGTPVKEALLTSAQSLPGPLAVRLLSLLSSDPDPEIRRQVARAAGVLCHPRLDSMVMDLERDRVADVAAEARAARRCGKSSSAAALFDDISGGLL